MMTGVLGYGLNLLFLVDRESLRPLGRAMRSVPFPQLQTETSDEATHDDGVAGRHDRMVRRCERRVRRAGKSIGGRGCRSCRPPPITSRSRRSCSRRPASRSSRSSSSRPTRSSIRWFGARADFGPPGAAAGIAMLAESKFPGTFKVFGLQGGGIKVDLINDGLIVKPDTTSRASPTSRARSSATCRASSGGRSRATWCARPVSIRTRT